MNQIWGEDPLQSEVILPLWRGWKTTMTTQNQHSWTQKKEKVIPRYLDIDIDKSFRPVKLIEYNLQ